MDNKNLFNILKDLTSVIKKDFEKREGEIMGDGRGIEMYGYHCCSG
jgi:hypothetical protein